MAKEILFSPDLLQSYSALQRYFKGERELAEIKEFSKEGKLTSYGESMLQSTWRMTCLKIRVQFDRVFSVFIAKLSEFFQYLGADNLSIRCEVLSQYLTYSSQKLKNLQLFKENLLAPIHNHSKIDSSNIYLTPSLATNCLSDKWVQQIAFPENIYPNVLFHIPKGYCRGNSNWFLYLYQNTLGMFSDPDSHIIAVSKQFEDGTPEKAALLQSLCNTENTLLDLNMDFNIARVYGTQLDHHPECLMKILQNFEPGLYQANFASHRMDYIKISNELSYVIDPIVGSIKFTGPDSLTRVKNFFTDWYYKCHTPGDLRGYLYFNVALPSKFIRQEGPNTGLEQSIQSA